MMINLHLSLKIQEEIKEVSLIVGF